MNAYAFLSRVGFRALMRKLYRVEVVGGENIPQAGGCIIASNHESLVDPFILGVATMREIRFMAKSELFANRAMAAAMRSLGAFSVERGGGDRVAFGEAAELLRTGRGARHLPAGNSQAAPRAPLAPRCGTTRARDRRADRACPHDGDPRVAASHARTDRGGSPDLRRAGSPERRRGEGTYGAGRASGARGVIVFGRARVAMWVTGVKCTDGPMSAYGLGS